MHEYTNYLKEYYLPNLQNRIVFILLLTQKSPSLTIDIFHMYIFIKVSCMVK